MTKLIQKVKNFFSLDQGIGWFVLFLITQTIAAVPAMGIVYIQYFDSTVDTQEFIKQLTADYMTDMSNWCLFIGGILLLSIYIARKLIKKEPIQSEPINKPLAVFSFLSGMAFNAIMISIGMVLIVLFRFSGNELSGTGSLLLSQEVSLFTIFVTGIMAPIQEEIGFRRGLTKPVYKMGNALTAIGVSAVVFGFMHSGVFQISMTTILGLFMGYIMLITGNVLYPILIHVGLNILSAIAVAFPAHELVVILVGGIAFIIMVIMVYRNDSIREMLNIGPNIKKLLDEHDKEIVAEKKSALGLKLGKKKVKNQNENKPQTNKNTTNKNYGKKKKKHKKRK